MAYLKLVGKNLDDHDVTFDVVSLPCRLGRLSSDSNSDYSIVLHGSDPLISRLHASLYYDESHKKIFIKCHSKNGLMVNKMRYKENDEIELKQNSAIKIGHSKLYVLLPIDTS